MKALKILGYVLALVVLLIVLALVFIDVIAKYVIESEGSKQVKAKVEVESVDIRFYPVGATLNGLTVTNPGTPMRNAFQAEFIDANLDLSALLKTKVIVDTANVDGMRFNTARETSGAIPGLTPPPDEKGPLVEQLKNDFKLPVLEMPDPKALLEKADLQTPKLAKAFEQNLQAKKAAWKARIEQLPDQEKVDAYKARLKAVKKNKDPLGFLNAAGDALNVKKEVEQDLSQIKSARGDFNTDLEELQAQLKELQKAPAKDVERTMAMVGLDQASVQELARTLFGDDLARWVQSGYTWYGKLQPYLNGSETPNESGPAAPDTTDYSDGLPKFLVKKLNISGEVPAPGKAIPFSGEFTDLTDRADIWGKPAKLFLESQQNAAGGITFNGLLNHVDPQNFVDTFGLKMAKLPISDITFSDNEDFPLTLAQALLEVASKAEIRNGQLSLNVDTEFFEVQLANLLQNESAPLKAALLDALKDLDRFSMSMQATGDPSNPKVSLETSLDKLFSGAVKGLVGKKQAEIQQRLRTEVQARLGDTVPALEQQLGGFVDLQGLLGERAGSLEKLL
ncbi:TIGR03545 family protein [Allohahella sp. A8]|uniref:TIGR03545 family protein n=1 Tax=Allohahella sp. A8 TaxID=3141461 RepID=UPI003A7FCEF7